MFVSPAYAAVAGAGGGGFMQFVPLVLIFVVFYFLLIRPQQKKARVHREMLGAIRRGDKVVTGGGIIGIVTKVYDDNEIAVEITDGVKVRVQRGLVATVLSEPNPRRRHRRHKPAVVHKAQPTAINRTTVVDRR